MTHEEGDSWESFHHFIARHFRGMVYEDQYVGTVKMNEEELEEQLFHPNDVNYNWLAYWKKHEGGRNATGSWKLRHPRHDEYVEDGMQVHITLFVSEQNDDWIDVYAHYEYDNICHPIKHVKEVKFSPVEGVDRATDFFNDNNIELFHLR